MFDEIYFNDEYMPDLRRLYDQVLQTLDNMKKNLVEARAMLDSTSEAFAFREEFEIIIKDINNNERFAVVLRQMITDIAACYANTEQKNCNLVKGLPVMSLMSTRSDIPTYVGSSGIEKVLSGVTITQSHLLYKNSLKHESWLEELAERGTG